MRDTAGASDPMVLPGDAWDLSPADPEFRILGILALSAGETVAENLVDQEFLIDLRRLVESDDADMPRVVGQGYSISKIDGVLYIAVTDDVTNVTVECAPTDEAAFLSEVQARLDARRAADARYYSTRAAILLVTVATAIAAVLALVHLSG